MAAKRALKKRKDLDEDVNLARKLDRYKALVRSKDTRSMSVYLKENKDARKAVIEHLKEDIKSLRNALKGRGIDGGDD